MWQDGEWRFKWDDGQACSPAGGGGSGGPAPGLASTMLWLLERLVVGWDDRPTTDEVERFLVENGSSPGDAQIEAFKLCLAQGTQSCLTEAGVPSPGKGAVRVIQSGGRTITQATARALNNASELRLSSREWGRALEDLKDAHGLPNNFHGKITNTGDYLDEAGKFIDSILAYIRSGGGRW
jgi:hypothetical protein